MVRGAGGRTLRLVTPVITASGCAGDLQHMPDSSWLAGVGAWVTPTVTLERNRRRPGVRIAETAGGVIYWTTWPNPGIETTVQLLGRQRLAPGIPVIVSIAADSPAEAVSMVNALSGLPAVEALELNLAGAAFDWDAAAALDAIAAWVSAVSQVCEVPVIVKLAPGDDIVESARVAEEAGADAVTVAHGWPALLPASSAERRDAEAWSGRLAGPAILPVTLRIVAELTHAVSIAIIGCGGINSAGSARAYLDAGASAVQIGSALLRDPTAAAAIGAELAR